jgi:hypothetical protein
MTSHAPGPWYLEPARLPDVLFINDSRKLPVASCDAWEPGVSTNNARLIAAAPDLLAALEEALYWCEQDRDNEDGYPTPDMFAARVDVIAAAIRKARGE